MNKKITIGGFLAIFGAIMTGLISITMAVSESIIDSFFFLKFFPFAFSDASLILFEALAALFFFLCIAVMIIGVCILFIEWAKAIKEEKLNRK